MFGPDAADHDGANDGDEMQGRMEAKLLASSSTIIVGSHIVFGWIRHHFPSKFFFQFFFSWFYHPAWL